MNKLTYTLALAALVAATPAMAESMAAADADVHRPTPSSKQYLADAMRDAQNVRQDAWIEHEFSVIDADGNGSITGPESAAYHDARFTEFDSNSDDRLSQQEVAAHYDAVKTQHDLPDSERFLEKKFNEIDSNHDGFISRGESKSFHNNMFTRTDSNKNAMLSEQEVMSTYRQKRDQYAKPIHHE